MDVQLCFRKEKFVLYKIFVINEIKLKSIHNLEI